MNNLPVYISLVFALTAIFAVFAFFKATNNSKITLIILLSWLVIQALIALSGFYTVTNTLPPTIVTFSFAAIIMYYRAFCYCEGEAIS